MNLTRRALDNPILFYVIFAFIFIGGIYAFFFTPTDLFPESSAPQVSIITFWPGASQADVSSNITQVLERELNTLQELDNITSISRDEVSSIQLEFLYERDIDPATTEVMNILQRVQPTLPEGVSSPQIHQITDATPPLLTVAVSPREGSPKNLSDIRMIAEKDLKNTFLTIPGVGNVEIFGGYDPEIQIILNQESIKFYQLSLEKVLNSIRQANMLMPGGYLETDHAEYIIKPAYSFQNIEDIEQTIIEHRNGGFIRVQDIGKVQYTHEDNRSLYYGNHRNSIALNIMRGENDAADTAISNVKKALPGIQKSFADLSFEITHDQSPIIDVNIRGMNLSLLSAIFMTSLIIFLFIQRFRFSLITALSIPASFFSAYIMLYFSPWTLNMVTLSALIIATGMVLDASIVVLENTIRLFEEEKLSVYESVEKGASQIARAIFAGMLTTIIVLFPIMYVGGYPQRILRPLSATLTTTLIASWFIAVTLIPLLMQVFLKRKIQRSGFELFLQKYYVKIENALKEFYISLFHLVLKRKVLVLIILLVITIVIGRVTMMHVGRTLMPDMDTGVYHVDFELPSHYTVHKTENVLQRIEEVILKSPYVKKLSSTIGSEPGKLSFGGGGQTVQQGRIQVTLIPRNKRQESIWDIMSQVRREMNTMPEIQQFALMEYGATPVDTTKAPIVIRISHTDDQILDEYGQKLIDRLVHIPGLMDVQRNWSYKQKEHHFVPKRSMIHYYGVDEQRLAHYLRLYTNGEYTGLFRLDHYYDIPIRVIFQDRILPQTPPDLLEQSIHTPHGYLPLKSFFSIRTTMEKNIDSRENLQNSLEIYGNTQYRRVSHIAEDVNEVIEQFKNDISFPIDIILEGTLHDMQDTMERVGGAILIGLVLLYLFLVVLFKSWYHPFIIMSIIPFTFLGAFLGLLIFNKPLCMPAMMGIILLNGTIVNNAILILTFILDFRKEGYSALEAAKESINLRLRPILITTSSTIIGLTPLALEWAVGLERMSPLGIVAIGGLIIGTFLSMVIVPTIYMMFEKEA